MSSAMREEEEQILEDFQQVHDLAVGVNGVILPSLWIVREGNSCWLAGKGRCILRPQDEVIRVLSTLGDDIAGRLKDVVDRRARIAIEEWGQRSTLSPRVLVSVATGLTGNALDELAGTSSFESYWEMKGHESSSNELMAAARMSCRLNPETTRRILEHIRSVPPVMTPTLDSFVADAREVIRESELSYQQGYLLAKWLRPLLGSKDSLGPIDPEDLLVRWGIRLIDIDLETSVIDAVGCWGRQHGPAIFINASGIHAANTRGRRATLAHEICHLLVDRVDALPLAEVLGGESSPLVEARAGAFAAEFLLPQAVAAVRASLYPVDPEELLRTLQDEYHVSREIIAWQIRNSDVQISMTLRDYLKTHVSEPHVY